MFPVPAVPVMGGPRLCFAIFEISPSRRNPIPFIEPRPANPSFGITAADPPPYIIP